MTGLKGEYVENSSASSTGTDGYMTISWDTVEGADSYIVYKRIKGSTSWTDGSATEETYRSYINGSDEYEVRVSAKQGIFESPACESIWTTGMPLAVSSCTVSLEKSYYVYDGTAKEPAATVEYKGSELTENVDYTVSYQDNVNAGTAAVLITGLGNYTGTTTQTFSILKTSPSIEVSLSADTIYVGQTAKLTVTAPGTVTYTSLNDCAEVDAEGTVTGLGGGTAVIQVESEPTAAPEPTAAETPTPEPTAAPETPVTPTPTATPEPTVTPAPAATTIPTAAPTSTPTPSPTAAPHTEHSFGSWTVTKTATVLENGEMKRVCSGCGYEETKSLAKKKASACIFLAQGKLVSKGLKLTWLKYDGATGYEVYSAICGKSNKYKLIKDTTKRTYTHTGLKDGVAYKYYVKAYKKVNGKKVYLAQSSKIHVAMAGDNATNVKKITVKKSKITIAKGKTYTLKPSSVKQNKKKKLLKHVSEYRYYSTDKTVATVNSKGKIKAKNCGTCKIYIIANNGRYKTVTVTVK